MSERREGEASAGGRNRRIVRGDRRDEVPQHAQLAGRDLLARLVDVAARDRASSEEALPDFREAGHHLIGGPLQPASRRAQLVELGVVLVNPLRLIEVRAPPTDVQRPDSP